MSTEEFILNRNGYGSAFNTIYIKGNVIRKECKNAYGKEKLHKEINFYKYIIENSVTISIPKIYEYTDTSYSMEYLKTYDSLYKVFSHFTNDKKLYMLNLIYTQLNNLHQFSKKTISKEQYIECLYIETHTKILSRVAEVNDIIKPYSYIKTVNGCLLDSFETIMKKISLKIKAYIEKTSEFSVCIIHGDCQFNNILYDPVKDTIVFIDPRGYYGNLQLFGIPEYDYAKIKFALSGYDVFDNMDVESLDIDGDHLSLPNIFQIDDVFQDDITSVLAISVWLGNAHCFKHSIPKAMFSYFYALYLATKYIS